MDARNDQVAADGVVNLLAAPFLVDVRHVELESGDPFGDKHFQPFEINSLSYIDVFVHVRAFIVVGCAARIGQMRADWPSNGGLSIGRPVNWS